MNGRIVIFLFGLLGCTAKTPDNWPVSYQLPTGIPQSEIFQVDVNGIAIPVEKLRSNLDIDKLPNWFTSEPYTQDQQEIHIADLSVEGKMEVRIRVSKPFNKVKIKPESRSITTTVTNQEITFHLPGPDKLYIQIDSLPELCFFANAPEVNAPVEATNELIYFGPGIHQPGYIQLKDNQDIYLAGGAFVYGGIRGDSISNVKIFGRGVLDGAYTHRNMVRIQNSKNISFEGITIRNGSGWTNTLVNCENVSYNGIKVISFGPSGDGINPLGSRNFTINNCFFRCTDDCIAIKSPDSTLVTENIKVTNSTMIGYSFSDGITIGFETNGPEIRNILVKDCDILIARGGSRVDGHSAFSIICDGPAWIHDITYENLNIEEPVRKLFELNVTDGSLYGINPPGSISDIKLKNINWASERLIIIRGQNENHNVRNVSFENCQISGKTLKSSDSTILQIGPFVEGISFN